MSDELIKAKSGMTLTEGMSEPHADETETDLNSSDSGIGMRDSDYDGQQTTALEMREAIQDIFGGDNELSEEFKAKTEALFEHAVATRLEALLAEADETIEALFKNVAELSEYAQLLEAEHIFNEETADLVLTQRQELRSLCEDMTYTDPAGFREKLLIVKDKHFPKHKRKRGDPFDDPDYRPNAHEDAHMKAYGDAVRRIYGNKAYDR